MESFNENLRVWSFDVSALMVLVGETEESNYRAMERNIVESLSPFPVVGLQCYLRSYDWLLPNSNLEMFSPYNCKKNALSNTRLASSIMREGYLDDGKITVCSIKDTKPPKLEWKDLWKLPNGKWWSWQILTALVFLFSWLSFITILLALFYLPLENTLIGPTTWIGQSSCIVYASWSLFVRVLEHYRVRRHEPERSLVTSPYDVDAIYIMGRRDSCFILKGTRFEIKRWTECGLQYGKTTDKKSIVYRINRFLKGFLRFGTLLLLLYIFTTVPNGSTADQLIFIIFNILGQANVLVGRRLNAKRLFDSLKVEEELDVKTRTHTYAYLIRNFPEEKCRGAWISIADLFPETNSWLEWKRRIIEDKEIDAKVLYHEIDEHKEIDTRKEESKGSEGLLPQSSRQSHQRAISAESDQRTLAAKDDQDDVASKEEQDDAAEKETQDT